MRRIAGLMGRSPNTISKELRVNRVKGTYNAVKAHHKAYVRRKYAKYQGMKIVEHPALYQEVSDRLYDDQSPEAIAGHIRLKRASPSLSKNAIYGFMRSVYGRRIDAHRKRRRKRRAYRRAKGTKLSNRVFIDRRPKNINERKRIGDAEADFIVSGKNGKGILLVVVDRKTRASFLERITSVTVENVHKAFLRIKKRFPEMRTVTTDNDILFQKHEELEELLGVKMYFCHPYHSWEKGTVENTNKVIRRDIPKGADLSTYSKRFIERLEAKLNRRPMKCLGYRTPEEVLFFSRARNKKHRQGEGVLIEGVG